MPEKRKDLVAKTVEPIVNQRQNLLCIKMSTTSTHIICVFTTNLTEYYAHKVRH